MNDSKQLPDLDCKAVYDEPRGSNAILRAVGDGSDSRAKAIGRWTFVLAWLGLWAICLMLAIRGIHQAAGGVRIEIQVGEKAPAPLERPEARSTLMRKVNTMKVREEYQGVKQGSLVGRRTVLGSFFSIGQKIGLVLRHRMQVRNYQCCSGEQAGRRPGE